MYRRLHSNYGFFRRLLTTCLCSKAAACESKLFVFRCSAYNQNINGAVGKSSLEQHFLNLLPLPLLYQISGALHLVQPGLMAGRQAGRLADEIQENFKNFKVGCRSKYSTCCLGTASLQPYQCIPASFLGKAYCKVNFKAQKFPTPM